MNALVRKFSVLAAAAGTVVALDQATKAWVHGSFALYESRPVIPGLFHLTYLRNPGAAFSFLAESPEAFRVPFFLTVTAVALIVISVVVARLPPGRSWALAGLSLVFAGAVGNLIDRVRLGEVVDFLDFHIKDFHWPAFNVADSLVCIGAGLLLWYIFKEEFSQDVSHPV